VARFTLEFSVRVSGLKIARKTVNEPFDAGFRPVFPPT